MQQLAKEVSAWRTNPVKFVRDVFNVEPDEWQQDVLMSFPVHNRLAMKASKGCGKSTVLSWLAWNFLATRLYPKIAATSISGDNLADGLWTEMAKWQSKSPLLTKLFHWTKTRIVLKEAPEQWWMSARSWPKGADSSQQANTLAGLHAEYLLFILDEVGGIPDAVMAAAEAGLATGIETKILMAGNPTHRTGPLYRACTTERKLWNVTEITSDPKSPKRAPRVSMQWAQEQIDKYGADNPWVKVNVFGEFPDASINSLLGPDEVMNAMNRRVNKEDFDFAQKRIGVDVARFGEDMTVLFPRQGLMSFKPVEMRNARSQDIASRIALAKSKWNSELELIDGTGGFGAGVIDMLLQAGHSPLEIHFSGKADDSRYLNKRAEMWFRMAEWIKKGGSLPNIPDLVRELTEPTYTFQNGKFQIEPKDQIKERLGFSPDRADALGLTFAIAELPSRLNSVLAPQSKYTSDYDPFDSSRL